MFIVNILRSAIIIDFSETKRGPGVWIFNNTLLEDGDYVLKIQDLIQKEKQCRLYNDEPLNWIDNLKYKIKRITQIYTKDKQFRERNEYFKLQNKFNKISNLAANNLQYNVNDFEEIKLQLEEQETKFVKGLFYDLRLNGQLKHIETLIFLELEKNRQENNSIKEIENTEGKLLTNTEDILSEVKNYYQKLYSCTQVKEEKIKEMSDFLSKKDSNEAINCDDEISLDEI